MSQNGTNLTLGMFIALVLMLAGAVILTLHLGVLPLSNAEAEAALGVFATEGSGSIDGGLTIPAYATPTSILFSLFGMSDAAARLIPAIAGIVLLMIPIVLRHQLGWSRVVLLQLSGLLSPVLVTTARSAGGGMLALLAWVGILILARDETNKERNNRWIALILGVLLCTGPAFLQSLLAASLTMLLLFLLGERSSVEAVVNKAREILPQLGWTLVVVFLLSTRMGTSISDLKDVVTGLDSWLSGWRQAQIGILTAFSLLPLYEPILLLCGAAGAFFALRDTPSATSRVVIAAAAGAFLAFVLYPGRQLSDLIWVVVPLVWLAAHGLLTWVNQFEGGEDVLENVILSATMLALLTFAYLQFQGYQSGRGVYIDQGLTTEQLMMALLIVAVCGVAAVVLYLRNARGRSWIETGIVAVVLLCIALVVAYQLFSITQSGEGAMAVELGLRLRFWTGASALLLVLMVFVLSGMGWSWRLAEKTAGATLLIMLTMLAVSKITRLNFPTEGAPLAEPLRPVSVSAGMRELQETLQMIALRATGQEDTLEIVVFGEAPLSLRWTLAPYAANNDSTSVVPPVVLFPASQTEPALPGVYRGQTLTLFHMLDSAQSEFASLFGISSTQVSREDWVLLVREDLSTLQPAFDDATDTTEEDVP